MRFRVRCMVSWLVSTSRRCMSRVSTTAIATLYRVISKASFIRLEAEAYANGLIDRFVVGLSYGIGGVWRSAVREPTPLTAIWTLCKAQNTSLHLWHCDEEPKLSVPRCGENEALGLSGYR